MTSEYANEPVQVGDDGEGFLKCPSCEEEYLHQHETEVGWRDHEDGPLTCILSNRESIQVTRLEDSQVHYGYRRDYLVIRFWCEICGARPELEIRQHKGNTIFQWIEGTIEPAERQEEDEIPF